MFTTSRNRIIRTQYLDLLGLYIPMDFPSENYQKIFIRFLEMLKDSGYDKVTYFEFVNSWISVADRFSSMTFADYEFSKQREKYGVIPPNPRAREIQDTALFSFFINSQSFIESLSYSIYILASLKNQQNFPLKYDDLERIHPELVSDKLNCYFPSAQLSLELKTLTNSKEYAEMKMIRNTLIHRTRGPPRRRSFTRMKLKGFGEVDIPLDSWIIEGKIKETVGGVKRPIDHRVDLSSITSKNREWTLKNTTRLLESMRIFILNDSVAL